MNKKIIISFSSFLVILVTMFMIFNKEEKMSNFTARVISKDDEQIMLRDVNNVIYTFNISDIEASLDSNLKVNYTENDNKEIDISSFEEKEIDVIDGIPNDWLDEGIFRNYYKLANQKLQTMSLDEKINQLLLVHHPSSNGINLLKERQFGGYLFFEKDFTDKNKLEVQNMLSELQKVAKIPILTAVDEEGGSVIRVSSNPNLVTEPFKSPSELYSEDGFVSIKNDTIKKSMVLHELGLNLNLAPVVDVSTDSNDYIHERTLKEDVKLTSEYAKTVIEASKGMKVSYTLKHFPGYGSNNDTHANPATDNRSLEKIKKESLPPFEAGIEAGAEAVLVSHNIITSIDSNNPATLSAAVHNLLRDDLNFTGIIITDDLSMGALDNIDKRAVKALLSGNDLLITADYETDFNDIKKAINDNEISENLINRTVFRILAWKYYKGLIVENQK